MAKNFKIIKDLIPFTWKLEEFDREILLHAKILGVEKFDSGIVSGYKVLVVYEVEKYLKKENPASSEEKLYSPNTVPEEIKITAELQGLV